MTRRHYLSAWWLVAVLSLIIAVLSINQIYQAVTRKPVSVDIRTPTKNEPIDAQRYGGLNATVKSVPPGFEITIVVYDVNSHRYNPSDKLCSIERHDHLKCTDIYLGKDGKLDKAQNFVIEIVGISPDAKKAFDAYNETAVARKYPGPGHPARRNADHRRSGCCAAVLTPSALARDGSVNVTDPVPAFLALISVPFDSLFACQDPRRK